MRALSAAKRPCAAMSGDRPGRCALGTLPEGGGPVAGTVRFDVDDASDDEPRGDAVLICCGNSDLFRPPGPTSIVVV